MFLVLRRREPSRIQEGGVVLAEGNVGLHLGAKRERCKGEGVVEEDLEGSTDRGERGEVDMGEHAVVEDLEASTDVGKGGEVDASERVVGLNGKISLRTSQRRVDQGGGRGSKDASITLNDRAVQNVHESDTIS